MSTKKAFAKPTASGNIRGCDPLGCGNFGAKRSGHTHQGEDYIAKPGDPIYSPISGTVTRFARPYADDDSYSGIEIKNATHSIKIFYMMPMVSIAKTVLAGDKIGYAQNISAKHGAAMVNHIHVEVRDRSNQLQQLSKLF